MRQLRDTHSFTDMELGHWVAGSQNVTQFHVCSFIRRRTKFVVLQLSSVLKIFIEPVENIFVCFRSFGE